MSHVCEDGYYIVYNEKLTKARKPHKCGACQELINKDNKYFRINIVYDGQAYTIKRCLRCQEIHKHLRTLGEKDERLWPDEELNCGEEYKYHWGKEPPAEIEKLAFALPGDFKN